MQMKCSRENEPYIFSTIFLQQIKHLNPNF